MPKKLKLVYAPWYRPILIKGRKQELIKLEKRNIAQNKFRPKSGFRMQPCRLSALRNSKLGMLITMNGERRRFYTLHTLRKLYKLGTLTPYEWYYKGILPEPYLVLPYFGQPTRFYTYRQMMAIILVINDFLRQGYHSIRISRFEEHKAMLDAGNEWALAYEKRRRQITEKERLKHAGYSRHHVQWID